MTAALNPGIFITFLPLSRRYTAYEDLDASIEEVDWLIQAIPGDEKVTWDELNQIFLGILGVK